MIRTIRVFLWVALAMSVGAGFALANEPEAPTTAPATETEALSDAAATDQAAAVENPVIEPAMALGQRVHVDSSGKIVTPRSGDIRELDARSRGMLNRSSEGLLEVPSAKSGVMVNLLGRFRSATVIELDAEAAPTASCVTTLESSEAATPAETAEVSHE